MSTVASLPKLDRPAIPRGGPPPPPGEVAADFTAALSEAEARTATAEGQSPEDTKARTAPAEGSKDKKDTKDCEVEHGRSVEAKLPGCNAPKKVVELPVVAVDTPPVVAPDVPVAVDVPVTPVLPVLPVLPETPASGETPSAPTVPVELAAAPIVLPVVARAPEGGGVAPSHDAVPTPTPQGATASVPAPAPAAAVPAAAAPVAVADLGLTPAAPEPGATPAAPAASAPADPAPAPNSAPAPAPAATAVPAPAPTPTMPSTPTAVHPALLARTIEDLHDTVQLAGARGVAHARMVLHPAELGGLQIRLRTTSEGIVATIAVDEPAALPAVMAAGADLRQSLQDRGVALHQLDVALTGGNSGGASADAGATGGGRRGDRAQAVADAVDPFDDPTLPVLLPTDAGVLLDVHA